MLTLCGITLATSALDSLNPIAIAQQFVLQSVVKRKKAIWAFIVGIGFTNFLAGMMVYYGFAAVFQNFISSWLARYPLILTIGKIALGAVCLVFAIKMILPQSKKDGSNESSQIKTNNLENAGYRSLFAMGSIFCGFELTSALPYFGFLAFLLQYTLSFPYIVLILLVYNIIYSLPLIILYLGYSKLENRFQAFYSKMQLVLKKVTTILVPFAVAGLGLVLIIHSIITL